MTFIPTSPDQLTPEWLTQALTKSGHLVDGRVTAVSYVDIGTGKMSNNVRYTLEYEGQGNFAPANLIGKFPAADEQVRLIAGAQGAYYNEVMFYRHLAAGTSMRTPIIYATEISEDRSEFLILMEDMAPAEPGSQLVGETRRHAELALQQAAKLAASYYGNDEIGSLDYVLAAARADGGAFGQSLMEEYWPKFVDRFGHGLTAECIAFGERYAHNHSHFICRYQGPKTLVHGDFRSENMLFNGEIITTVDWQTVCESSPMADAAYFLGGSVELAARREWERELVESYRNCLAEEGAILSQKDCWEQYREYAMQGLMTTVLGACFTTPAERSDRMFLTLIQRHLQHCVDLNAGEFLP
jgi:hypothetical protein